VIPIEHSVKIMDPLFYPWIGTADAANIPEIVKCICAKVSMDLQRITCFIGTKEGERTLSNLTKNPRMTLLIASALTYEAYQYKGAFIKSRPCTEEEALFQKTFKDEFMIHPPKLFGIEHFSEEGFSKMYFATPSVAVEFRVEEIFEQTPKKGTGEKI
jgi:hypothetical protein